MTIREYIRINSKNTVLNGKDYNFNEVYTFYLSFKNFGKKLYKEYNLKPIIIKENNIIDLPWPFLTIDTINISTYFLQDEINNYFSKLETEISKNEIYSLAILIGEISRILKFYNYHGAEYINQIESRVFNAVESINRRNPIIFEYDDINCFPCLFEKLETKNSKINSMKEDLLADSVSIVINHNYLNLVSLIMHFIKIEIMYYTSINKNSKPPKKCGDCHKLFIGNSDLCENCASVMASARRTLNNKCAKLRKNILKCIKDYKDLIPSEIAQNAKNLAKDKTHRYTQFEELNRHYEQLLKYINKKS